MFTEGTSTARRKSKVKSQKSKELYSGLLRHLKWYVYFRRVVLGSGGDKGDKENNYTSATLGDATRSLLPRRGTLSTSALYPMPNL